MKNKLKLDKIPACEITPEHMFHQRREFLKTGLTAGITTIAAWTLPSWALVANKPLPSKRNDQFLLEGDTKNLTAYKDATRYNNFYELGTGKNDPVANKDKLITEPWQIEISGEVEKTQTIDADDLLKTMPIEERIYRFRCVEAWSMVVPWTGFQLSELIKQCKPTSKARYVRFVSIHNPDMLPLQKTRVLDWPYEEGLRMDEAMNPLTFMALGMYGKTLPNQNGAPVRLLVPWKYGYKSAKSIVKIEFLINQPVSTWTSLAPHEYGFYSNVNPNVSHPRWSQKRERPLGSLWKNKKTQIFNGYGEHVAELYKGMDLKKYH